MWIGGRPDSGEGETIALVTAGVIAAILFLVAAGTQPIANQRRLRVIAVCVLCFGADTAFGIDLTAKGWFWLRLSVMQEQLQKLWNFPPHQFEPPR
jgi:hypothetical protein